MPRRPFSEGSASAVMTALRSWTARSARPVDRFSICAARGSATAFRTECSGGRRCRSTSWPGPRSTSLRHGRGKRGNRETIPMNVFGPSAITTREKMARARVLQLPVLAARRLLGRGPEVRTRRHGIAWCLDLREGIDFSIWLRGSLEPSTIAAYRRELKPGATVIDVGANMGSHTLEFARTVGPQGRVLACEPTAHVFARLLANLEANRDLRPRVHADQVMLMAAPDAALPAKLVSSWPLGNDPERDKTSW